jgi:hypothetical protein
MILLLLLAISDHGRIVRVAEDYTSGPLSTWHKRSLLLFFPENATDPVVVHGRTPGPLPVGDAEVELGSIDSSKPTDRFKHHYRLKSAEPGQVRRRRSVPDGERSLLIVMLNYTDSTAFSYCDNDCAYTKMWSSGSSVNEFFKATTFNRIHFPASAGAVYSIAMGTDASSLSGCPVDTMASVALDNWNTFTKHKHFRGSDYSSDSEVVPSNFDHVAFYIPASIGSFQCHWAGSAYVNACNEGTNRHCRLWLRTTSVSIFAHELGHNIGLHHAASDPDDDRIIGSHQEYGDDSDVMGSSSNIVYFNRPHLEALGYHTGRNAVTNSTLFIDNFFNCTTGTTTVSLGATAVDPFDSKKYTAIKFYRVPSSSEVSDTTDYCGSIDCGCGHQWKTTLFYDLEYNVQRTEYIYYYISYRDATSIDSNLATSGRFYIHSYAPNPTSYWVDKTYRVAVLASGESWSSSRTGVTVTAGTGTDVSISFTCASGSNRPSCSDCPAYTCSEPISTSSTSSTTEAAQSSVESDGGDTLSTGAIVGIIVGLAFVVGAFFFALIKRRNNGRGDGYNPVDQSPNAQEYDSQSTPKKKYGSLG